MKLIEKRTTSGLMALAVILSSVAYSGPAQGQDRPKIRLVMQVTVDGLRGDLLSRYSDRFVKGGFKRLLEHGTVFANAHYQHANTETIVGHTTLATGAYPSGHGMIGNVWYDRKTNELSYNIEDPQYPLLPSREKTIKGEQVDPAQKRSRTQGRSPTSILAETVGDKLMAYFGGRSKVFGVSGKDRSAVAMAGHAGKAFWYSTDTGDFVTSTYYYESYPEWVALWNAQRRAESFAGKTWTLLNEPSTYLFGHYDDRPYEVDLRGYGRVFPHTFGQADNKLLYTQIMVSPVGDRLTVDFVQSLVRHEKLGQDDIPDYLSISFSGVDAVNHFFGPSSLENEDVVLHLDRTLGELFQFIEVTVGFKHTLMVLSADHGMPEMPEYMTELGFNAGRLSPDTIINAVNTAGRELFGIEDIVHLYYRPYVYLDASKIAAAKVNRRVVEEGIAAALSRLKGIHSAVSRSGLESVKTTPLLQQIRRNYHPMRSGDIYVVQEPYWFSFEEGPIAVAHGSPWAYDTHVPIIFAGPGIAKRTVHRRVHPVDVAPTIATLLGMTPPSSTEGTTLPEVFQ